MTGAAAAIAMVPLTIDHLGTEKYGILVVILSLSALLQLADLGIGNALIRISARNAADNEGTVTPELIFNSYLIVGGLSLLLWLLSVVTVFHANLQALFNYTDVVPTQLVQDALIAFLTVYAINLPLSLTQQIRLGTQEGYKNGWYISLGQIANVVLIMSAIHLGGDLAMITTASLAGSLFFNLANTISLLSKTGVPQPFPENFSQSAKKLLNASSGFLALQLIGLLSYNIDSLIIAYFLGPPDVSTYSIALKIYSIPGIVAGFFYSGLWAAYADAERRSDFEWIIRTFKRSLMLGCFFVTGLTIALIFLNPFLFQLLSRGLVSSDYLLVAGMAFFAVFSAAGGAIASLSNGLNLLKPQIVISSFAMLVNVSLSLALVKPLGTSGPVWGTVISLALSYPIFLYIIMRHLKSRITPNSNDSSWRMAG